MGGARHHCRIGHGRQAPRRQRRRDRAILPSHLAHWGCASSLVCSGDGRRRRGGVHGAAEPAYLESLVGSPVRVPSSAAVGQALGQSPGPQDFSYTRALEAPGAPAFALPSTYDLRPLGRVTSVKDQNPYGTCWSFAACGSLESCLLPGESRDVSEDNMVLTSGFNYPGIPYDAGGQIFMSTALSGPLGRPRLRG